MWLPIPPLYLLLAVSLLSLLYAGRDLGFIKLPLPERQQTVPKAWGRSGSRGMMLWGRTNGGCGFVTSVSFPGYYVVLAWAFAMGNTPYGALIGLTYGIARAIPLIVSSTSSVSSVTGRFNVQAYRDAVTGVLSHGDHVHLVHGVGLILFGLGLLAVFYLQTGMP